MLEDGTASSGIRFERGAWMGERPLFEEEIGGGACWGDHDGDGRVDLYLTNASADPDRPPVSRLYRNVGGARFEDATESAGVAFTGRGEGCVFGDYDNDGHRDLYVLAFGPNVLYRNRGDGTFEDATAHANVSGEDACSDARGCWSSSAAWLDFDRDGFLDLYVANYVDVSAGACDNARPNPKVCRGQANVLFRNRGDGSFEDVAPALDVATNGHATRGRSLGVVAQDVDGNGWPDVYVANDQDLNVLFLNTNGTFRRVGPESPVTSPWAGMGVDAADIDGDGLLELLSTHLVNEPDGLYRQTAPGEFVDASTKLGLNDARVNETTRWGAGFHDFDLDGDLDLFVANGEVNGQRGDVMGEPNVLLLWDGARFVDAARDARLDVSDLGTHRLHRAAAFADVDDDGDVDVLVAANVGQPALLLNRVAASMDGNPFRDNRWIGFRLEGVTSNRDAVGARLTLTTDDGNVQVREVHQGGSFEAGSDVRVLFGLGAAAGGTLAVRWPSGIVDSHDIGEAGLAPDRYHELREGDGAPPAAHRRETPPMGFLETVAVIAMAVALRITAGPASPPSSARENLLGRDAELLHHGHEIEDAEIALDLA